MIVRAPEDLLRVRNRVRDPSSCAAALEEIAAGSSRLLRCRGIYRRTLGGIYRMARVAEWAGGLWRGLGQGMDGVVCALTLYNGELVAGGYFGSAGGATCNRIARFDGTDWQPLGSGMNAEVRAVTVYNGDLIAGGAFTNAGGVTCNRIARWDGENWQQLTAAGFNATVRGLTVYDGELIAVGDFTLAGGVSCSRVARWDGATWSALGTGLNSAGWCATLYSGDLAVGGEFTTAGGIPAVKVARWDGAWHALGGGVTGSATVYVLCQYGSELLAGGYFLGYVRLWNGSDWAVLGGGANNGVFGADIYDGKLVIGGMFTEVGGVSCRRVAQWDGSVWSPLAGGQDDTVRVVFNAGAALDVGGDFNTALSVVGAWQESQQMSPAPGMGDVWFDTAGTGGMHLQMASGGRASRRTARIGLGIGGLLENK